MIETVRVVLFTKSNGFYCNFKAGNPQKSIFLRGSSILKSVSRFLTRKSSNILFQNPFQKKKLKIVLKIIP